MQSLYIVAVKDESASLELRELVAMSLLRLGMDTKGARLFNDVLLKTPQPVFPGRGVDRLAELLGMDDRHRAGISEQMTRRAVAALEMAGKAGLTPVAVVDDRYPVLLKQIPDPPIVLWCRGEPRHLTSRRLVSIVGSRNATPEGLAVARRLAKELAGEGIGVVSGLARGIDGAAHRGALDAVGVTIAVLGCGADTVYPPRHDDLAAEIAASGVLVAEYPPATPPLPRHFPLRNRIISALSRATLVVEASERSGSLITARAALEQGRDVLAVPGGVASGCYRGCHALIKDGARLVETVDDIFDELGWDRSPGGLPGVSDKSGKVSWLSAFMPVGHPCGVDTLSVKAGRPVAEILAELTDLEVAGTVDRLPGGRFVRLD